MLDPAFALQQLPDAVQLKAESVRGLAEAAEAAVSEKLESAAAGPFTVHVYVPEPRAYRTLAGRASLLEETFLALCGRRKAFRRYVPWKTLPRPQRKHSSSSGPAGAAVSDCQKAPGSWSSAPDLLDQLALVGRTSLLGRAATSAPGRRMRLAPWPGGRAPVPEDRRAPSRAYRKLVEAFAWLGVAPTEGEVCVDLGGSPGGWAWNVLQRGASVIAIDRAPLAPPAAGHPRLTARTGDAFSYRPATPVDWLLCDVIAAPNAPSSSAKLDACRLVPAPDRHDQAQGPHRRRPDPPTARPSHFHGLAHPPPQTPLPPPQRVAILARRD